ncbi:MAG: AraC family transcriptional regulator [Firmicutes bacterium]|nr:AraC family transcriptional regulator [Bacillota bacterium]
MQLFFDSIISNSQESVSLEINKVEPRINAFKHTHHYLELDYIESGNGVYWIDNKKCKVAPGDLFIINNKELHGLDVIQPNPLEIYVLNFEPQFLWSTASDLAVSDFLRIFFYRGHEFSNRISNTSPQTQEIIRLIKGIKTEFQEKNPEYQAMIRLKLMNILILLSRCKQDLNKFNNNESEIIKNSNGIILVMDYIHSHWNENITLEQLAEIAHLNPSYLSTLFKKLNGISPIDYINKQRIRKSLDFLLTSDKNIIEIATLCGFNNTANFNKTFKKITGFTPSKYKKGNSFNL